MAYMVYSISMFPWEVPKKAKILLLGLMVIVAGMRVLLIGFKNRKVWIGVALCLVYGGVYFVVRDSNFLFLAACTMGFLEIDYQKIIRTYLIAVGTALVIVVSAAMMGWIENYVTPKYLKNNQIYRRQAMGTIYPTDFASLVLFLLLYFWVALKKVPDWVLLILPAFSFLIAWRITYSVTGMICSVLFLGSILYHMLDRCVISKHLRFQAASNWIIALLAISLAGTMVFLTLQVETESEFVHRLDKLFSNRLYYANLGWKEYGLHPFGSFFEMVGLGASKNSRQQMGHSYNFIDCSYLLILIRDGYVLLLTVLALWTITIRRIQKAGDRRAALAMAIIAIHSISEHHMAELHYNIALAMPLAAYVVRKIDEPRKQKGKKK